MAGFQLSPSVIFLIWISASTCSPVQSAVSLDRTQQKRSSSLNENIHPPFVKCFNSKCDLRFQYCDSVISNCASCREDCHPGRIAGDEQAIQDCQEKCGWFYYFNESSASKSTHRPEMKTGPEYHSSHQPGQPSFGTFMVAFTIMSASLLTSLVIIAVLLFVRLCNKRRTSARTVQLIGTQVTDRNEHCRFQDNVDRLGLVSTSFPPSDDIETRTHTYLKTASDGARREDAGYQNTDATFPHRPSGHAASAGFADGSMYPLLQSTGNSSLPLQSTNS
jgi:hypothetical protein